MNDDQHCGLYAANGQSVPLRAVHISGALLGNTARVTVAQTYRNSGSGPIEAVYTFPLATGASVCGFEATVGDRRVSGQVTESDKAFERYDDAMADGHGAFLLDQERPNVFTASVGNLNAGHEAVVEISCVCKLEQEGDAVRFVLPTTVAPRYVPATSPSVGQPDAERVNPPKAAEVPYAFTVDFDIRMLSPIASIESPSHSIRTELQPESARITLGNRDATMDRDFVLLVEEQRPNQPGVAVEERDGEHFAMIRLLPSLDDLPAAGSQEIHFVLDCSGSMGGTSIAEAVRALELCVRALSEGDRFNVVPFGSSYRMLWPEPRAYTQETLDAAVRYVRECGANMGGTEILTPLKHILEQPSLDGVLRKVLLLTDGQVSNEADVIQLVQAHRSHSTVFSFGIGAGASEHLVRGVAQASGGVAEFIFPGERIEPKVLRTFGRVRVPSLPEPSIEWSTQAEVAPARLPRLYPQDVLTVFARSSTPFDKDVRLVAGDQEWSVDMSSRTVSADRTLSTLWARHRIQDMESKTTRRGSNQRRSGDETTHKRDRLVSLSKKFGVLCGETSFVAVDIRPDAERTQEQAELRVVPVALTDGWGGGHHRGFGGRMVASSMGAPPPSPMAPAAQAAAFGVAGAAVLGMDYLSVDAIAREEAPGAPREGRKRKSLRSMFKKGAAPRPARDAAERSASASDPLYDVLLTQAANGSFRLGSELEALVGSASYASLQAAHGSVDDALLATAAVVHWLKKHLASRRTEWLSAVNKADAWLSKQPEFDVSGLLDS